LKFEVLRDRDFLLNHPARIHYNPCGLVSPLLREGALVMKKLAGVGFALLATVALAACSSGGGEPSCKADTECGRYKVCNAQKLVCETRPCTSSADCGTIDQVCVPLLDGSGKVCTHTECVPGVVDCTDGKVCVNNLCETPTGEEVIPDVIEDKQQTEGTVEETTPETIVGPGDDCTPCTGATDCPEGYACSAVGSGKFCLKNCATAAECKGGYVCYPVSTAGKQCLPMSYACVECAYKGCDAGKCCDLVSGQCNECKGECGKCTYDFECGDGSRCYKKAQATTGVCVPECAGGTCAATDKFTCGANADGVKICTPIDDSKCQPCPPGQVLLGDGKTCAECKNDAECMAKDPSKPKCDLTTYTCGTKTCTAPTKLCSDNNCHTCCADGDCTGQGTGKCVNFACEGVQTECEKAGIDCSTNPYYQACCVINGSPQCCGCNDLADCVKQYPDQTCECSSNMCIDSATSQSCGDIGGTCAATCTTDADCPPPASGTGTLSCHAKGFCYDPAGSCDNAAACCMPGQTCFDMMSLLFGGMGGGIPGMPGGGMPMLMASCSCTTAADCLGTATCTPLSAVCIIPLIGTMFCPGGAPPATAPASVCFDISKLLGGI
jgi:hypothetical protein